MNQARVSSETGPESDLRDELEERESGKSPSGGAVGINELGSLDNPRDSRKALRPNTTKH